MSQPLSARAVRLWIEKKPMWKHWYAPICWRKTRSIIVKASTGWVKSFPGKQANTLQVTSICPPYCLWVHRRMTDSTTYCLRQKNSYYWITSGISGINSIMNTLIIWRTVLQTIMYGKWLSAFLQWRPLPQLVRFRKHPCGQIIAIMNGSPVFRDWIRMVLGIMEIHIFM